MFRFDINTGKGPKVAVLLYTHAGDLEVLGIGIGIVVRSMLLLQVFPCCFSEDGGGTVSCVVLAKVVN